MTTASPPHPEDVVAAFEDFDLQLPRVGYGGMKSAYRIGGDDQRVLKLVHEPMPENTTTPATSVPERVNREIEAMRRITHPRIVQILDGPGFQRVAHRTYLWYIEPFFPGGTLENRLSEPWTEGACLHLLNGLVDAAEILADTGIVHRDIKPSNIVFDHHDEPVLLDLGIAYFHDLPPLTESLLPSPRTNLYAAPEQFIQRRYSPIDHRTDMFLLGIVFFMTLTNIHPFSDHDPDRYMRNLASGTFNAVAFDSANLSTGTRTIVHRLLHPSMSRRYPSFSDLRSAIAECR